MSDQAAKLRKQLLEDENNHRAKTISVVSGKGGVGKSNISINLSIELLKLGKKVLLIDMDFGMGNVDVLLGLQAKRTIVDLFQHYDTFQEIIEIGPHHLAYISGGSGLTNIFSIKQDRLDFFFEQFEQAVTEYDYIFFDIGAGASETNMPFVLAADECIVVTTPEPTSITDAYSMMKHIINKEQKMPIYIVMNQVDTVKSGRKVFENLQQVVSRFLNVNIQMLGILPYDRLVSQAVIRQTPYVLLDNKADISRAMQKTAFNFITQSSSRIVETGTPRSFIHKLRHFLRKR